MKYHFLEYPEYIEKYPGKTIKEWVEYKTPIVYKNREHTYELYKNQVSEEERLEAEEALKSYKAEFMSERDE